MKEKLAKESVELLCILGMTSRRKFKTISVFHGDRAILTIELLTKIMKNIVVSCC